MSWPGDAWPRSMARGAGLTRRRGWARGSRARPAGAGPPSSLERWGCGPAKLVVAPARYYTFLQGTEGEGGYPTSRHLRDVIAGVHRSNVIRDAGAVFSTRGDDFVLTVGGDLSVGYRGHDTAGVHLFCVETLAPQLVTPEAVCLLRP